MEQEIKQQLHELAQQLYKTQSAGRRFIPKYPWVLVYVLPKEQQRKSGLWLPDHQQNKVNYEGIVLETWNPFERIVSIERHHQFVHGCCTWCYLYEASTKETEVCAKRTVTVDVGSNLKAGDHIMFPHYLGLPVGTLLDEVEFRIVPEENPRDKEGKSEVLGTVDYGQQTVEQLVGQLVYSCSNLGVDESHDLAVDLIERFHIAPKKVMAVSISGK